jgi:hypothetical protein
MTKTNSLLLTLALIIIFTSSKAQNSNKLKSYYADTTLFKIDTVINNVLIDGKKFSVKILRDKFNEHLEKFTDEDEPNFSQSPMTIILTNIVNNKIMYVKRFDFEPNDYPYLNYSFYKGQQQHLSDKGKLYLLLNKGYGGSGSQSTRYFINLQDNKINFSNLFNSSDELSYVIYNKNDNEITVLDGIWNTEENESHFANHRYIITKYVFSNGSFEKKEIGQTEFKYSSLDEDKSSLQILEDINTREPSLLKQIDLADYNIRQSNDGVINIAPKNAPNRRPEIFYLGDSLIPTDRDFKLIGISSETGVHHFKCLINLTDKYFYGRQIGDITIGIKNGIIVTTIYNLIPKKEDVGVPNTIIEIIQKTLSFPFAYINGVYGVNIDNTSISISRTNNPMTFNKDRIMILTSVKQSILSNK